MIKGMLGKVQLRFRMVLQKKMMSEILQMSVTQKKMSEIQKKSWKMSGIQRKSWKMSEIQRKMSGIQIHMVLQKKKMSEILQMDVPQSESGILQKGVHENQMVVLQSEN